MTAETQIINKDDTEPEAAYKWLAETTDANERFFGDYVLVLGMTQKI